MNSNFNDKKYWSNYYGELLSKQKHLTPSPFAQFLIENNYLTRAKTLIELGCGNGRDALFFAKKNIKVTAIDQCSNTTELLNTHENILSFSADFTKLENLSEKVNIVYSRFTLHSINEQDESETLNWAFENLTAGGFFCIEVRTTKDPLCGKGEDKGNNIWFHNSHHRRFLEAESFKLKLENIGFKTELFIESNGFAIHNDEDPIVLRAIVKKL
tara:strand:+ start:13 stop:654 length:642 start_codon:yes stop_codon:yes gene_type:complete